MKLFALIAVAVLTSPACTAKTCHGGCGCASYDECPSWCEKAVTSLPEGGVEKTCNEPLDTDK